MSTAEFPHAPPSCREVRGGRWWRTDGRGRSSRPGSVSPNCRAFRKQLPSVRCLVQQKETELLQSSVFPRWCEGWESS